MYYQIDVNGFFLGIIKEDNSNMEFYTNTPISGNFYKFRFNGIDWVEGATQSEIDEYNIINTPQEVQLWRIRTVLKLMGLENIIETALNNLEEPTKTGALYIWNYGTTVERYSQTVLMLQMALQMTNEQVDQMFVQANNIQL